MVGEDGAYILDWCIFSHGSETRFVLLKLFKMFVVVFLFFPSVDFEVLVERNEDP